MNDVAKEYQGLFSHMSREHGLILTIGEMDEIIRESQNVVNKISSNVPVISSVCESLNEVDISKFYDRRHTFKKIL
jgi:hypothetical protein